MTYPKSELVAQAQRSLMQLFHYFVFCLWLLVSGSLTAAFRAVQEWVFRHCQIRKKIPRGQPLPFPLHTQKLWCRLAQPYASPLETQDRIHCVHCTYHPKACSACLWDEFTEFKSMTGCDLWGHFEAAMASETTKMALEGNMHIYNMVIKAAGFKFEARCEQGAKPFGGHHILRGQHNDNWRQYAHGFIGFWGYGHHWP